MKQCIFSSLFLTFLVLFCLQPLVLAQPVQVQTGMVVKVQNLSKTEVVGTVEAVHRADIAAKVTGNIIRMEVGLGTRVTQGDLLFELSAGEITAQQEQVRAQLEQTKRNLAREEGLLKKNATTPETVKALKDSVRIAEAAYEEARTMRAYTQVKAPFSGIITQKHVNTGDLATPGRPLLRLENDQDLQVLTAIPEAMMLSISAGDTLAVFIPSTGLELSGVVSEISPVADPSSRTAPLKLKLPMNQLLRPGQFARVALALAPTSALLVPTEAITAIGQMERVYVVADNTARLRLVRSGAHLPNGTEVLAGLEEGEVVVVAPDPSLVDGQQVVTVQ